MTSKSSLSGLVLLALVIVPTLSAQAQNRSDKKRVSQGAATVPASISVLESTRAQDGLIGPVRRVRTETAKLSIKSGQLIESPRQLLENTTYNLEGRRIENTSYPIKSALDAGRKQDFKYDDKGNVIEMTLRDKKNSILSREVYTYEFDTVGNWKKMITSLLVFENGVRHEPVEVTYRTISYYLNESVAKVEDTAVNLKSATNTKSTTASPEVKGSLVANPRSHPPVAVKLELPEAKARLISDDEPDIPKAVYPDEAKNAGVSGIVTVKVTLDPQGKVVSALPISGHEMLRAAAVQAAMNSRFLPSQSQSRRSVVISFTFSLLR